MSEKQKIPKKDFTVKQCPDFDFDCLAVKNPLNCWEGLDTDKPFNGSCPLLIRAIKKDTSRF